MRRMIALMISVLLTVGAAQATDITEDQARMVARNFVASVVAENGSWAEELAPSVTRSGPMIRRGLVLGYFVEFAPEGVVLVGRLRELAPILAYSEKGRYLPDQQWGFLAFVEDDQFDMLDWIASRYGPLEDLDLDDRPALTGTDWPAFWRQLETESLLPAASPSEGGRDYVPGTSMLTTEWDQLPPYNLQCPDLGCSYSSWGFPAQYSNAWAGCTPVAAAQIMNYWSWPPQDDAVAPFDWDITHDQYIYQDFTDSFIDQDGSPISELSIYHLAYLIAIIGEYAGTDYGCDSSSTVLCDLPGRDMLDAFEDHFYYYSGANCDYEGIGDDFSVLVQEFNANRPVLYTSANHSFVVDGWNLWGGVTEMVHIVYGHGGDSSGWWTMQSLLDRRDERVDAYIRIIQPIGCLGAQLPTGNVFTGPGIAAYRYLNLDATGQSTNFLPGNHVQFRDGVRLAAASGSTNFVQINGDPADGGTSYLFARTKGHGGARIDRGAIKLLDGGGIKIH